MYEAHFVSDGGAVFRFGYHYGTIFDIDPLSGLDVEMGISQGFAQVGVSVESQSVGGVARTVSGRIVSDVDAIARRMFEVFTPFTGGKLYFGENYYCDCLVKKSPIIGGQRHGARFSLMLYCPYPFWLRSTMEIYAIGTYTPAFRFPINYNRPHRFGIKADSAFVNIYNPGTIPVYFDAMFTATAPVENYGLINIHTMETLQILDTLEVGQTLHLWRNMGRMYADKMVDGQAVNAMHLLNEDSTLYRLHAGDNVLSLIADSGKGVLQCLLSFHAVEVGVRDGM